MRSRERGGGQSNKGVYRSVKKRDGVLGVFFLTMGSKVKSHRHDIICRFVNGGGTHISFDPYQLPFDLCIFLFSVDAGWLVDSCPVSLENRRSSKGPHHLKKNDQVDPQPCLWLLPSFAKIGIR